MEDHLVRAENFLERKAHFGYFVDFGDGHGEGVVAFVVGQRGHRCSVLAEGQGGAVEGVIEVAGFALVLVGGGHGGDFDAEVGGHLAVFVVGELHVEFQVEVHGDALHGVGVGNVANPLGAGNVVGGGCFLLIVAASAEGHCGCYEEHGHHFFELFHFF